MLLNRGRKIAFLGLLLAINQILIVLSCVIDISTLAIMAAAAFLVGIAVCEYGLGAGCAFFAASCLLGFILIPNKLYMVLYVLMGLYVLIREVLERRLGQRLKKGLLMALKLICFDICFTPLLILAPNVFLAAEEASRPFALPVLWLITQAVVILCDRVYDMLMVFYNRRIRKNRGGF